MEMTSNKPYIVKAFYDWLSDNDLTPYISVDVSVYGVLVPMTYVNDGQIILNISSSALGTISMGSASIEFSARFGGKLEHISVPYGAISAIYAKENGAGTSLAIEHIEEVADIVEEPVSPLSSVSSVSSLDSVKSIAKDQKSKGKGKPTLTVIK
jgi:stringent starvation protein B